MKGSTQRHCLPHRQRQEVEGGSGEIATFLTFAKLRLLGGKNPPLLLCDSPTMECRLPWKPFQCLRVPENEGLYGLSCGKERMGPIGVSHFGGIGRGTSVAVQKFKGLFWKTPGWLLNCPTMQHDAQKDWESLLTCPLLFFLTSPIVDLSDILSILHSKADFIPGATSVQDSILLAMTESRP